MNWTDEQLERLIAAVKNGDGAAFSALLSRYRPLIHATVSRFVPAVSRLSREELLAEAALALYRAALRYDPGRSGGFGKYAGVCITNALISEYRKEKKPGGIPLSLESLVEEGVLPQEIEAQEDLSDALIEQEDLQGLYTRAGACLSRYEFSVFRLYAEGYTVARIAAELGREEKSVSNALARLLSKLRAEFS